jgi:hypothetical protein
MAWNNKFIDRAREGEFRIVCYPTALEEADIIIGARKFSPKKIKASLFDKFLGKLAEGNRTGEMTGVMHFEFWSQGSWSCFVTGPLNSADYIVG